MNILGFWYAFVENSISTGAGGKPFISSKFTLKMWFDSATSIYASIGIFTVIDFPEGISSIYELL